MQTHLPKAHTFSLVYRSAELGKIQQLNTFYNILVQLYLAELGRSNETMNGAEYFSQIL
jgi:hypothetical protein